MTLAQHHSITNEHPTPEPVVKMARDLLGAIDLDPASTPEFNSRVRAAEIYTQEQDGLTQPWYGNVFLNPPGGKLRKVGDRWVPTKGSGQSSAAVWWGKLVKEYCDHNVLSAFFVGFSLEILRTGQSAIIPPSHFPHFIPAERLHFSGSSPSHANVLVWLPPYGRSSMSAETHMALMLSAARAHGLGGVAVVP